MTTTANDPNTFINQANKFLQTIDKWDVLLLAGNNIMPYKTIDNNNSCVKVSGCLTTTGYLVSSHYYDKLIQNIKMGITFFMRRPQQKKLYAIDVFWKPLQEVDNWYLLTPLTVIQMEDYSDIEQKKINYADKMTNLNKKL